MSQQPDDIAEMKARLKAEAEAARAQGGGQPQEDVAALKARLKAEAEMLNSNSGGNGSSQMPSPGMTAPATRTPPAVDPEMEAELQRMKEARERSYGQTSPAAASSSGGPMMLVAGLCVVILILWLAIRAFVPQPGSTPGPGTTTPSSTPGTTTSPSGTTTPPSGTITSPSGTMLSPAPTSTSPGTP